MTTHEFLVAREVRVLPAHLTRRSADASALSPTLRPSSRRTFDERPATRTFLDTGLPRSFIVPGSAPSANRRRQHDRFRGRSGRSTPPARSCIEEAIRRYIHAAHRTEDRQTDRRYVRRRNSPDGTTTPAVNRGADPSGDRRRATLPQRSRRPRRVRPHVA